METLILKENSPQIRELIKQHGIDVCSCCESKGSLWLNYNNGVTKSVHGVGYPDEWENLTPQQEILRYLEEVEDPIFCIDVNDFIVNILRQQGKEIDPDIVYAHNVVMSEAYDRPTYEEVMHCMEQMIEHKNSEFRNQEQSLLYTLYSILDGLAVEGEARDIAIKEFKEHLINNDLQ